MTKQHITLEEVKANARKAYDEGNLLAQQEGLDSYFYRRADVGCAIGVSLTKETGAAIQKNGEESSTILNVLNLPGRSSEHSIDNFITWNENEGEELADIQTMHDFWAMATFCATPPDIRTSMVTKRNYFLLSINHLDAKLIASSL